VPSSLEYAVSRSRDKGSSSSTSVCKRVLVRIKGRGELSTAAYIVAEYFSICYLSQRLDCVVSTFNSCLVWVDLGYARRIPTWSLDYVHMKRAGWGDFRWKATRLCREIESIMNHVTVKVDNPIIQIFVLVDSFFLILFCAVRSYFNRVLSSFRDLALIYKPTWYWLMIILQSIVDWISRLRVGLAFCIIQCLIDFIRPHVAVIPSWVARKEENRIRMNT
jgi:hypothetical protein